MEKLKVYISSTFLDMADTRKLIIDRIQNGLSEYFELVNIMERMSGDFENKSNVNICLQEVQKANLYIILSGNRYGSYPEFYEDIHKIKVENKEKYSYTELEYITAVEVLKEKFYGIYKFSVTDDFFVNEGLKDYSDLADENIKSKHTLFMKKLSETVSFIKINNSEELSAKINDKLTEFYMRYTSFLKLNLNDFDKMKINRQNQVKIIREKKDPPDILMDTLGSVSKCVAFVINTIGEKDYYNKFTLRLRAETIETSDLTPLESYNFADLANCATDDAQTYKKILDRILRKCTATILGQYSGNLNFDTLYQEIVSQKIQNKFICINIEIDKNNTNSINEKHIKIITEFINKINSILKSNNFNYNFFFIIYLIQDLTEKEFNDYYKQVENKLPGIECINLYKLGLVSRTDVIAWLDEIIKSRKIEKTAEELYNFIFINQEKPEGYYKDYIEQIEKRTFI